MSSVSTRVLEFFSKGNKHMNALHVGSED